MTNRAAPPLDVGSSDQLGAVPEASSVCPICRVDTPHGHSEEQLNAYAKTRNLDSRVRDLLIRELEHAQGVLDGFNAACTTCRALNDGYVRRTVGSANPFRFGMRREGERAYCPTCKRCVYDDA